MIFNKLDVNSDVKISGELKEPKEKRNLIIKPSTKSVATLAKTTINKETIDIKDSYSARSPTIDGLILEFSSIKEKANETKIITKVVMKGPGIEVKIPEDYKELLRGVFITATTISGDLGTRFNDIQIAKRTDRIITVLRKIEPSLANLSLGTDGIIYGCIG